MGAGARGRGEAAWALEFSEFSLKVIVSRPKASAFPISVNKQMVKY